MALHEIEPYILDPDSEPELEVEQQHRGLKFHHNFAGTDLSSWDQNGCKIFPQPRKKSKYPHQPESILVTLDSEPREHHMIESEIYVLSDEGDFSEEEVGGNKGKASSDEEWVPQTLTEEWTEELEKTSSEDSDEEELPENEKDSHGQKIKQLCTDCGSFHYSKNHVCEHKTKLFVCNVCGKRCVSESSLRAHCNIHSETYEHYCKYCYGTFKTKMDKLNHEQTHQKERKPYKCPDCEMTFASLIGRRKHMKSHKGPDEFKCNFCGLTIGKKHKVRHMMIHTGAKPFKCSICERTFNQGGNLKSHMRLHTGERPFKCQHCDKAFNHNVSLKSHVQRYHSQESGSLLDKIHKGLADTQDVTVGDSGDTVEKQDTEDMQKPKDTSNLTGRPRGRPKRNSAATMEYPRSKSSEENVNNSYDSNDESQGFTDDFNDLIDFHQEEILKAETNIKRKNRNRPCSDSDYDPNEEIFRPGKRGQPRDV